ncbi:MAG TPA: cation diffusion facilitator family transporter [Gemmatimonadaceae bacterium]|nr:cation diffusion facilitator family transporter [Gemmatimonadaceae bacterium]
MKVPPSDALRGVRAAQLGVLLNATLAAVKLIAGVVGNSYALVADAIESAADALGSLVVWGGISYGARPPDEEHPFGHGKAEALAAAVVALMLLGAAVGLGVQAARALQRPHDLPASWTLLVLVIVVVIKWAFARRQHAIGSAIRSTAVHADAWHHVSDAVTSAAAFLGISLALIGTRLTGDTRWAVADEWAALAAAAVIAYNGITLLRRALDDLMDRMPGTDVIAPVRRAAESVPGVLEIEKLHIRKMGLGFRVSIHVQADGSLSLDDAHRLGGRVKGAIQAAVPAVVSVLVHMEPHPSTA